MVSGCMWCCGKWGTANSWAYRVGISLEGFLHGLKLVGIEEKLLVSQLGVWYHGKHPHVLLKLGGPVIARKHKKVECDPGMEK